MCSAKAGQLTKHFVAHLNSDALKSARNLRLHFISFHCEMPPPWLASDNLTYMSRLRRHMKLHAYAGPCQSKKNVPFDSCSPDMRYRSEALPGKQN